MPNFEFDHWERDNCVHVNEWALWWGMTKRFDGGFADNDDCCTAVQSTEGSSCNKDRWFEQ